MEDNERTAKKTVAINKQCSPNRSLIDEIKAQDIYTLHSPENCPFTLPSVSTSVPGSFKYDTLFNPEPVLKKSKQRCWSSIMKKQSVQQMKRSIHNLPALIEEDHFYLPSVPIYSSHESTDNGNPTGNTNPIFNTENEEVYLKCFTEVKEEMIEEDGDVDEDGTALELLDDNESWVDLSKHTDPPPSPPSQPGSASAQQAFSSPSPTMPHAPTSPDRVTPLPFGNGEEYLRLLREAQKESNQSSARVSLASSRRDTPRDSPKSPPNSPNTEMVLQTEESQQITGVYVNYYNREGDFVRVEKNLETDWIWDWSSRPDQTPPKEWRFVHPRKGVGRGASIRRLMVGNSSLFSRDVLYTLLITNVLSLILGTGIGIWLSKRSGGGSASLNAMPIN